MKQLGYILVLALAGSVAGGCANDDGSSRSPMPDVTTGRDPAMGTAGSAGMPDPGTSAPAKGPMEPVPEGAVDIVDTALAAGDFTQLAAALTKAGLVDTLRGEGPFTVFAPTDEAFAAFEAENPGVLESLSPQELSKVLTYHVISGAAVGSADLKNGQLAQSLAGPMLAVDLTGVAPKINDATVTAADVEASNGVIHVIDHVLLPPGDIVEVALAAGSFNTLAQALTDAGLVDTLKGEGPFTVFAPTDEAFAKLAAVPSGDALADVLTYHVLPGIAGPLDLVDGGVVQMANGVPALFDLSDGAKIDDANITVTNIVASNGVIHVIDAVILPPQKDIVQTAIDAGSFTTLASALTDAGLVETLQGEGPFTVFAPTDEAFAKLPAVPSGDALKNVLLYHVVDGAIGSGNLSAGNVEMLSGGSVTIGLDSGVTVDGANVTTANILARNGVIHVVDGVLVPR